MKWEQSIKENNTYQQDTYIRKTEGVYVANKILLIKDNKSNQNPVISSIGS